MQKAKKQTTVALIGRVTAALALALLVVGSTHPGVSTVHATASCTSATDCQSKISNTNSVISSGQQQLSTLAGQASSYQDAISNLQSQINGLQSQISSNQAQQTDLNQQIATAQAKLDHERDVLSVTVRAMYIDGQMTTIEMLATSNNLSDYIDKEAYRQQIQSSVQDTMSQIAKLQNDLSTKKQAVETLLTNEQTQQSQVVYARQQQSNLLSYNQSQQAAYNHQIASSKSDLSSLKARLAALNTTSDSKVSSRGTCGGGYPNSEKSRYGSYFGCDHAQDNTLDSWKMLNRECVSYTAYMVDKLYGVDTTGWSSAYKWIAAAEHASISNPKISIDQSPRAGDIAIRDRTSDPSDVGHAMYVVSARSGSDITVQEYNQHEDGMYQQRTFNPHSYLAPVYYIHFK